MTAHPQIRQLPEEQRNTSLLDIIQSWILDAFYIIPECTVQGHKPFQYKRGHWKLRGEGAGGGIKSQIC